MSTLPARIRTLLRSWRARGGERPLPPRIVAIEMLAARAQVAQGAVRAHLETRLETLVAACPVPPGKAAAHPTPDGAARRGHAAAPGTLGELLEHIARQRAQRPAAPDGSEHEAGTIAPPAKPDATLPALHEFRQLWSQVRTESQLRQSLREAPENAGPLNSNALLHRALTLMSERSPGYLRHFLAYVDALSWTAALNHPGAKSPTPPPSPGKRPRSSSRKRRT